MKPRSFRGASGWLAMFVFGLPALFLLLLLLVLDVQVVLTFAVLYGVLLTAAYVVGLIVLVMSRGSTLPDWLRALLAVAIVYLLALVTPLISVMASYPLHVIRCGGLPVVASEFAAAMSYSTPRDGEYAVTPLDSELFCTEQQAEAAGYHDHRSDDP